MKIETKEDKKSSSFMIKILERFEYPEATSDALISHIPTNAKSINLYKLLIDNSIKNIDEFAASAIKHFFIACQDYNPKANLEIECNPSVANILELYKLDHIAKISAIQSHDAEAFVTKFGKR